MKIKVLHCIESIGSGGVEQRRLSLSKFLDKNVFEQALICAKVKGDFDLKLEALGTKVYAIGPLARVLNLKYYVKLIKIVREFKPDIIHGAVFEGVISAVVGGLLCRVPVIIIEETSDPQNRSWRGTFLLRFFSLFADHVVGISPSVVQYLQTAARVSRRKLLLINNGVATPEYPKNEEVALLKKAFGIRQSDFVIGSVGRLRNFHKRFSDLIHAIALLKDIIPNIKLLIVGAGEDEMTLKQLTLDLNVNENVVFAGFQKDTAPFYACMDVFCLASYMEGFGLVLIEAMFFRLPVIATAVGGMKDIVLPGETGLLVGREAPKEFATAILYCFNNQAHSKKMGENGYARAHTEYSAEAYVRKVEKLYLQSCLKKKIID